MLRKARGFSRKGEGCSSHGGVCGIGQLNDSFDRDASDPAVIQTRDEQHRVARGNPMP